MSLTKNNTRMLEGQIDLSTDVTGQIDLSTDVTGQLDLSTNVTGVLPAANGGTGDTSLDTTEYAMTYSGASVGPLSTTTSWADLDLSATVGANRALVVLEIYDTSTATNIMFRTKGSSLSGGYNGTTHAAWGASGTALGTGGTGGYVVIVTDASGVVEHKANVAANSINLNVVSYQKLA